MQAAQNQAPAERLTQLKQQRDEAKKSREYFSRIASEAQDDSYAAETEGQRLAKVASARTYREQAGEFAAQVMDLSIEIAALEAQRPVKFEAGQVEGMDETMDFRAEVAA